MDLGFLSSGFREDFEWIPLKDDPLLAVLPKDYPSSNSVFPLRDFDQQPFIISAMGTDVDVHRTLDAYNVHPDIQYSAKDDSTIISMVACGLGVSILPQLVLDHYDANVVTKPLQPFARRQLGIALSSREMASPATLKFIEYAEEYIWAGNEMPSYP